MRRTVVLLALSAATVLLPAQPASAACTSGTGITACPPVHRCFANGTVSVRVVGVGTGTASCGGGVASCLSFRVSCNDTAITPSAGTLTCSATGTAVAICTVTIAAT